MDLNAYLQNFSCLREQVCFCPLCPGEQKLWNNGSYLRNVPSEVPGLTVLVLIFRKLCSRCRTSFSLHPEQLLKRQRFSLAFVSAWLWAFLHGTTIRARSFLETHSVRLPADDPKMSWSDSLDYPGQRTRPGYQLLRYWSVLFGSRAQLLLPEITQAFIQRRLTRELAEGWQGPERARSLQLAWLHWEALWRARSCSSDIDTQEAFRQLVRFLAKAPSHKVRRAVGGRYPYDVIIQ